MVATNMDQLTADYVQEQAQRAALQDSYAEEREMAITALQELIDCWGKADLYKLISELPDKDEPVLLAPLRCDRCDHWQAERPLHLADGTTQLTPGCCTLRAAAGLSQMLPHYAKFCRFFSEEIPF